MLFSSTSASRVGHYGAIQMLYYYYYYYYYYFSDTEALGSLRLSFACDVM